MFLCFSPDRVIVVCGWAELPPEPDVGEEEEVLHVVEEVGLKYEVEFISMVISDASARFEKKKFNILTLQLKAHQMYYD